MEKEWINECNDMLDLINDNKGIYTDKSSYKTLFSTQQGLMTVEGNLGTKASPKVGTLLQDCNHQNLNTG